MNLNKALWIGCGTAVAICVLFLLKPLIPSAPERTTSGERILLQPERTTSVERVETNRIATTERIINKQLSAAETMQSNLLAMQIQQQIDLQQQFSNYNIAKAELASEWIQKLEELKKQNKTDQNSLTLAHTVLKSQIAAKYNVSLDSEPVVSPVSIPVVVQPPASTPSHSRQSLTLPEETFRQRYGLSRSISPPTHSQVKKGDTTLLLLKQKYRQMEQQMWAIEKTERCYQKFPDGSFRKMNPKTRHWVIVPASEYDPGYDNIRLLKDQLLIRINQIDPGFH